ncbi:MAG: hypothetical protein ACRES9_11640 [Gammaproteobacteria bacterium]
MDAPTSLPQGYEWLSHPHRFRFAGGSGLLSECTVSAAVERGGSVDQVYVLCSELKQNWGTPVTNAWGPSMALELQLQRHIFADAGEKLEQPDEPILDGLHYEVTKEEVEGWHFFEHYAAPKGENGAYVLPVIVPYEGLLYGPRVDLSDGTTSALLAAMTREVANRGFTLKEASGA